MDLIGVIITADDSLVVETDYLAFVMDLRGRIGDDATNIRPGCEVVGSEDGPMFLQFMTNYRSDIPDLRAEYEGLDEADKPQARREFLPCIVIDFVNRRFVTSYEESGFVNFEAYLPQGWTYSEADVTTEVPAHLRYWVSWK